MTEQKFNEEDDFYTDVVPEDEPVQGEPLETDPLRDDDADTEDVAQVDDEDEGYDDD